MKETAVRRTSNKRGRGGGGKRSTINETTYEPDKSLEAFLELRQNKEVFTMFVKNFLKPAYSTKWKAKRCEKDTKRLSDIITVSDEAFVLLTLENNWERWIDINNKCDNNYTPSTRREPSANDSNVMPKYTHINKKKDDIANKKVWRGWNEEGIVRFNELCKAVKVDRKKHSALDKTLLEETEPVEKSQRPRKRRGQLSLVPKAFVDSDGDKSSTDSEAEESEESIDSEDE